LCCSMYFLCSMYCLFCFILCIVCVYMCTVLLPPGGYPIAIKYIISYFQTALTYVFLQWERPKFLTHIQRTGKHCSCVSVDLCTDGHPVWIRTYSRADGSKKFPEFSLLVISSCMQFWYVSVIPKHMNCATFPKHLLPIFLFQLYHASCSHGMDFCLISLTFDSRPLALIAVNKSYMFFFVFCMFLSNKLTSVWTRSRSIPFSFILSLCA
jgi:hypothetical protein